MSVSWQALEPRSFKPLTQLQQISNHGLVSPRSVEQDGREKAYQHMELGSLDVVVENHWLAGEWEELW